MAGLDDLYRQIPVDDIAARLGADRGEVDTAIRALVPTLVGGLQHNANADDATAGTIETAAHDHAAAGLLDGGVSVDDVDRADGDKIVGKIFAGRDSDAVASALAPAGVGSSGLIKQLLPILAPIVLAYIGKQFGQQQSSGSGGGIGDILGSILGGGSAPRSQNDNPLGGILGGILGGGKDNPIGDILGGLLGGKR